MIRDRLFCGVNHERIQRRLLAESRLDLKKALELATAMEKAHKNMRDVQQLRQLSGEAQGITRQPFEQGLGKQPKNVIAAEGSFLKLKNAGTRVKSVIDARRKATRRLDVA